MEAPGGGIEITAVEVVPFMSKVKGGGYNFTLITIEGVFCSVFAQFLRLFGSPYI